MKFYPAETVRQKLGFDKIIERLCKYCVSPEGAEVSAQISPFMDSIKLLTVLKQTVEMRDLCAQHDPLPVTRLPFLSPILEKTKITGGYLLEDEFSALLQWLKTTRTVYVFIQNRAEQFPELAKLCENIVIDQQLIKEIERVVGPDGFLLPTASPTLAGIRRKIATVTQELRILMDRLMRAAIKNGYTESRELTIRNDRIVMPIIADFKGKVPGFIHDVSGSGQTVYIEPVEALSGNNEIRELKLRERNEIIRILTELTDKVRPAIPGLRACLGFLTAIDVLRAKAKIASDLKATMPKLSGRGELHIYNGRHPLLIYQKGYDKVVPLQLRLSRETERVMLISGPNAGGKSVALKTVGLLQLMLQSGMLIPVDEHSTFPVIRAVFVDLGDDQSIANDLSTYTSHLTMMLTMLEHLDSQSLFLIDEFGTGTDPTMGGPIAESLLEAFLEKKALGIITTHYSNLKEFGEMNPHVVNASMRFDLLKLEPVYSLEQGLPGSSFAFEIAARIGIPDTIINRAKTKIGSGRTSIEALLAGLQVRQRDVAALKAELETKLKAVETQNQQLTEALKLQKTLNLELEQQKRKIIQQGKESVRIMLREANARIENTIRQIKEAEAERSKTSQLRKTLEEIYETPTKLLENADTTLTDLQQIDEQSSEEVLFEETPRIPIKPGDFVRLVGSETIGQVTEVVNKRANIVFGHVRASVQTRELIRLEQKPVEKKTQALPQYRVDSLKKAIHAEKILAVLGLRVEAALPLVEKFMDDAIQAGLTEVVIIHGRGTGALRRGIREFLKLNYPQIRAMQDADYQDGGTGKTIVTLK